MKWFCKAIPNCNQACQRQFSGRRQLQGRKRQLRQRMLRRSSFRVMKHRRARLEENYKHYAACGGGRVGEWDLLMALGSFSRSWEFLIEFDESSRNETRLSVQRLQIKNWKQFNCDDVNDAWEQSVIGLCLIARQELDSLRHMAVGKRTLFPPVTALL